MRRLGCADICAAVCDLSARQKAREGLDASRPLVTESRIDDHLRVSGVLEPDDKAMLNVAIRNPGVTLTNREALAVLADDPEVIESGHIKVFAEKTFRDGGVNQHILQTVNFPYLASEPTRPAALSVAADITER